MKDEDGVFWLAGWYATRLHASNTKPGDGRSTQALCKAWVYADPRTEWAQRKVDKGPPRCKRCLAAVEQRK